MEKLKPIRSAKKETIFRKFLIQKLIKSGQLQKAISTNMKEVTAEKKQQQLQ